VADGSTRILEPRGGELVRGGLTVSLRVDRGARVRALEVGERDVRSRLRRVSATRFRARVPRRLLGAGLRTVYAEVQKGSGRTAVSQRFVAGHRRSRILAVRIARGATAGPVSADVRTRGRIRTFRATLNGRRVSRVFGAADFDGHRHGVLSASHGLRHGANRLVITVVRNDGAHATVRRRIVLPSDRPLSAAGTDRKANGGAAVTLDGRRSRAARHGRLRFRWSLVKKPKGSRATLRGATRARPSLKPDRIGTYRARLRVVEDRGATAAAASTALADAVSICNDGESPTSPDYVPPAGFKLETFVRNPHTDRWAVRLTNPASTAEPQYIDNQLGNDGADGILVAAFERCSGALRMFTTIPRANPVMPEVTHNDIVVLAAPGISTAQYGQAQFQQFQAMITSIGGELSADDAERGYAGYWSAIGVPGARAGSAHQNIGLAITSDDAVPAGALVGRLTIDDDDPNAFSANYDFIASDYVPFATIAATDTSGPAVQIGDGGADWREQTQPGFGLYFVDAATLSDPTAVRSYWFAYAPGTSNDGAAEMLSVLDSLGPQHLVAVASSTRIDYSKVGAPWMQVAQKLAATTGAPHDLLGKLTDGGFVYVGRLGVRSSYTAPGLEFGGGNALSGVLVRDANYQYAPLMGGAGPLNYDLATIGWQDPTPFPYANESWYQAAQDWFAGKLEIAGDIRRQYPYINADQKLVLLQNLNYPGDGHGFTEDQFALLWNPAYKTNNDLDPGAYYEELQWVQNVNDLVTTMQTPLIAAEADDSTKVSTIADAVKSKLPQVDDDELTAEPLYLLSDLVDLAGEAFDSTTVGASGAAAGVIASTLSLIAPITKGPDRQAAWTAAIESTADSLAEQLDDAVVSAYKNLDKVRFLILTDPVKLETVGAHTTEARWELSDGQIASTIENMGIAAKRQAWPKLLSTVWAVRKVVPPAYVEQDGSDWKLRAENATCLEASGDSAYVVSADPDQTSGFSLSEVLYMVLRSDAQSQSDTPPAGLLTPIFADPFDDDGDPPVNAGLNGVDFYFDPIWGTPAPTGCTT
jgi:hypothetical protein